MLTMLTIYALQLENNKYYIGKTYRNIGASIRFEEHKTERGSEWTKLYKPISIIEEYQHNSTFEEDNLTKKYMMKYGIENVRGGSYTKIVLDDWLVKSLEHEFKSVTDACYKCGKKNHFANECEQYNYIDEYISRFETETDLDSEILKLSEVRKYLEKEKGIIEHLKYGIYTFTEGEGRQRRNVEKKYIIEPKLIDEFDFKDYNYETITRWDQNKITPGQLYTLVILQKNVTPSGEQLLEMNPNNVIENIYKIYVTRIKKERSLKQILQENSLSQEDYIEEINNRIQSLYEKYATIVS